MARHNAPTDQTVPETGSKDAAGLISGDLPLATW